MSEVDNLSEAFAKDVGEVVTLHDLLVTTLVDNEEHVEATIATIYKTDLVVSPLVIRVLVHAIVALVKHVDNTDASRTSLQEEGELDRIVGWQRHQICDVLVC